MEISSKSNKKMMILSALGIMMVVDAHAWTAVKLFTDYIPYNSFFMPMFIFISGYFCKVDESTEIISYIGKKFRRLMIPYLLYSLVALAFEIVIGRYKLGTWDFPDLTQWSEMLLRIVTDGEMVKIAAPMWFVPTLFCVSCIYAILRKYLLKIRIWNDYLALVVFLCINVFVVHMSRHVVMEETPYLLISKCGFMLPFYQLGYIYHTNLEDKIKIKDPLPILLILLVINVFRILRMPDAYDIAFNDLSTLAGFKSASSFTPIISSVIGIFFWLEIAELLVPVLQNNRLISYISDNTFWIMAFHITAFNLFNCILMIINRHFIRLEGFDDELVRVTHWYRWETVFQFRLVYFAVGLVGTVVTKMLVDTIYDRIKRNKLNR